MDFATGEDGQGKIRGDMPLPQKENPRGYETFHNCGGFFMHIDFVRLFPFWKVHIGFGGRDDDVGAGDGDVFAV